MDFENVSDILSCPICQDIALPPIYQCARGHIICNTCIPLIQACPTCRSPFPSDNIRNLALEQLAPLIQVKCKLSTKGCDVTCRLEDIDAHSETCGYEYGVIGLGLCQQFGSQCNEPVSVSKFGAHCLKRHPESTRSMNNWSHYYRIGQSAMLEDLIHTQIKNATNNNTNLIWSPCFLVSNSKTYVILSKYVGSSKSFHWSVVKVEDSIGQGQWGARSPIIEEMEITVPQVYASSNNQKSYWRGKIQGFPKWQENYSQNPEQCDPNMTFSLPLSFFVDESKRKQSLRNVAKWELDIAVNVSAFPNPGGIQQKSLLFKREGTYIESKIYKKVVLDVATEKSGAIQTFHRVCDVCGMHPIEEAVFSCTQCQDFDLCPTCAKQGYHDEHVLVRKRFPQIKADPPKDDLSTSAAAAGAIHGNAKCDACGVNLRGVRYKCCICQDLDLCEICEEKGFHDFHWLVRTITFDPKGLSGAITSIPGATAVFPSSPVGRGRGRGKINPPYKADWIHNGFN